MDWIQKRNKCFPTTGPKSAVRLVRGCLSDGNYVRVAEVGAFKRRSQEDTSRRIAALSALLELDPDFVMQKKSFDAINLADGRDFLLEDDPYDLVIVHSVLSTGMRRGIRVPGHERELLVSEDHNINNWKRRLVETGAKYIIIAEGQPYTLSGWELGDLAGYEVLRRDAWLTVYREMGAKNF